MAHSSWQPTSRLERTSQQPRPSCDLSGSCTACNVRLMSVRRLFVDPFRVVSVSCWRWVGLRHPTLPQRHIHFLHLWACRSQASGRSRERIVVSWNRVGGASERALAPGHRPSSLGPGRRCSSCISEAKSSAPEDANWYATGRDKKVDGIWLSHANVCPFSRIASRMTSETCPLSVSRNLLLLIPLLANLQIPEWHKQDRRRSYRPQYASSRSTAGASSSSQSTAMNAL